MNQDSSFGSIVKEYRRARDLTQAELARRVGCAAITIRKIEADALRPSQQIAERLAMGLGVPLEDRLAFVRLARTATLADVSPSPLPTPPVTPAEIGLEDLSGRAIRGYSLGERLGTGGYGVVYRAVQPLVEREVAVKIILPQYADHPDFIRRFESEAQLVARLEHPHIVPLYDYWREPGVAYLVMRLLRGGSLAELLIHGPLPLAAVSQVMEQVGAALHAAHRAGVVHRDLKPANVLLDEDGNAYLADFGVAKNLGNPSLADMTQPGMVIGSPAYFSPEQILVEPVRPQSDIYCLGIMLYELLTGQKPFQGPTPIAYIQQHLNDPLPSLLALHPELPPALDPVIQRATAKDQAARYPDLPSLLADFRQAAPRQAGSAQLDLTVPSVPLSDLTNPYKGLRAFGEADALDFFGRETLVQELLRRMSEVNDPAAGAGRELARFLAVVGPSGSGKSSVVRAGLIPALRQGGLPGSEKWFIIELLPGAYPWEELEAALLRIAVNPPESLLAQLREDERGLLRAVRRVLPADDSIELVLVIDQFEELFTLTGDEPVRAEFLNSLVTATLDPRSRLRLVITLRADFTDRPLRYMDFGELLRQRTEFVLPLTPDELEQAITGPAQRVGLALEAGLTAAINHDVGGEPGALPLLQYALTELFEQREGRTLTRSAYHASGGVLGALARRADELYAGLDEVGQETARQLFLRLVTLGEGTEDTRRRVPRTELSDLAIATTPADNDSRQLTIDNVIDTFGKHRLLSFDRDPLTRGPTVEVAHEALLREWGRLREWLDASRGDIRWQRLLAAAAAEWREARQDASFLLQGTRLDQFAAWAETTTLALTPNERTYLEASLASRQARRAAEAARQRRELETAQKLAETESRAAQRLRWLALGLVIFLLAAAGLAGFAFKQQGQAEANQARAEANLALSESQRLAAEANTILQSRGDPELAALLSLRALKTAYTGQADMALQLASAEDYGRRLFTGHTGGVSSVAFSPDGQSAVSGSNDATARIWDVQTGQTIHILTGHEDLIREVAFSPDGNYVLTGSDDHTARLWDAHTGQQIYNFTAHTGNVGSVAFSPDARYALTGSWDTTVRLWEVQTGEPVRVFGDPTASTEEIWDVAFSPDGKYILTTDTPFNEVGLWDTKTGQLLRTFTGATGGLLNVAWTPDGQYILGGDGDGFVRRWSLHQPDTEPLVFSGHTASVEDTAVSPDGQYALTTSVDQTARLWDIKTGQELRRFTNVSKMKGAAFSPDSRQALLGYDDGTLRLWDVQPPVDPRTFAGHTNVVAAAKLSPDGRYLLTGSHDNTARLWDAHTGQQLHLFEVDTDWIQGVAFSPDSRYAVTASWDSTVRLWDVATGREIRTFLHPDAVLGVVFTPDGRHLVTTGWDNLVRLWDVETGQKIRDYQGHTAAPSALAVSPDGRYILSGSNFENMTRLWDLETGQEVRQFPGYYDWINGISFSPDSQYILTSAEENIAYLWEVATGEVLQRYSGDLGVFSTDGQYILTGGQKSAHLWDRATGQPLRAFGVTRNLWGIDLSPDGRFILIYGEDKLARLWDIDYHNLVDSVCARILRDLTERERVEYNITDTAPTCPPK